ncbi:TonB-dependent receptor plug domain-containing protein [Colwellia sp. 4_MG-2023]|uniref:TonB-dependent siderophore receptor n=1 Tax=unclassified Colwellia TaxID=196834 RepID=UPI0026E4744B|nr:MULTISPECIES: TonB-dependent receptor plug domain-containing protein [unclassified Colwellia]MDO6507644.1 TonB-dependent receptor plug domain-containing protein [Colwellia sp. 5_MG-2023]MDO6555640.1 TonB-dependent receptor plug domain-containing protein [Colwellia sp. 4_MG-2023]
MTLRNYKTTYLASAIALGLSLTSNVFAADEETKKVDENIEKIEVRGSLGSLPGQAVESVFGFGESILETPRSVSTISNQQMERFAITDLDELVAFSPGTFTQSFFGVAGSLDVRGTPGENYFRGVKRLDNPGNFPTPIGASSSVDIVRGPASPIHGPSKIGGYLNFTPKSSRATGGQYLDENKGEFSITTGSWDKSVITAEVGGPAKIAGKEMGFYLYGEIENSGSFYDNSGTDQTIFQASFNGDITDNFRFEVGGMYHKYDGNQVAGWNRLTQDLIDNGTYTTGTSKPLDTNGDGSISHQEYGAVNLAGNSFFYVPATSFNDAEVTEAMMLENVGTATLSHNQVLTAADDQLANIATTLYLDMFYYTDSGWEIKNQLFYDAYDNINENAYGFAQKHDSYVVENKLVFSNEYEFDSLIAQVQISPSVRYTNFKHADDFTNEYFNRRDLTMPSTALDRRLLATRIDKDYDNYDIGSYTDYGIAAMSNLSWDWGLNVLLGLRYDTIDIETTRLDYKLLGSADSYDTSNTTDASKTEDGVSWNTSISYKSDFGLVPYITLAEQGTLVAGQGAEIGVAQLESGAFDVSKLTEYGVKGSFLDDSLYFALSFYEQERTDFNAQSITTNATTRNEGTEFELRWVFNEQLVLSAGYTNLKVYNLTAIQDGGQFGFLGAEDLVNLSDPALIYGGNVIGLTLVGDEEGGRKAGMPEDIYSVTATYDFQNGFAANASVVNASSTYSGFSQAVELPSYTLMNAGVFYDAETWTASFTVKNLTDEKYYRSNFPDLFGGQVVLPELPRHVQAKFSYKF